MGQAVEDKGRRYTIAFLGGTAPNAGAQLFNNPRHRNVIEDTPRTFQILKAEKVPDIFLPGHPQAMFADKVERIKAGETPHPLLNGDVWTGADHRRRSDLPEARGGGHRRLRFLAKHFARTNVH